jgi:LacI family transcriptional regulator
MARQSRGVTLSDIAERIGVSKVTVSYVLNERPTNVRISDQTRRRILDTAQEMGYHPNALARNLARRCTDTIALVMQSPHVFRGGSGFINDMMHGVMEGANDLNYDLMLHTKVQPDTHAEALALSDGRTDGSLLLRDRDDPLASALEARGHPCISIFSSPNLPNSWFVDTDNVLGGQLATQHLLTLGHRRIAYIGGSPHSSAVMQRYEGYRAALENAGLPHDTRWQTQVNYAGGDFAPIVALMRLPANERPTALFAWSDDIARRTIAVLREECGLRVPEDVSVIGFDGTQTIGEHGCTPMLTSVRQPIFEIAKRGVALLAARIRGETVAQKQIALQPTLVVRESCAPPRSGL